MITDNLSAEELALLTNIIAIEICKGKSTRDINIIANIYDSISTQMFLIAAQRDYIDNNEPNSNNGSNNSNSNSKNNNSPIINQDVQGTNYRSKSK